MNILLTSVGRRAYIVEYFKQALNKAGSVHAANSHYTIAMQVADKSVCTPKIYDSEYINFLLSYCRDNTIKTVVSLFDVDMPVLSKAKKKFEENGICVVVSDYWVTQVCNDKLKAHSFLKKNNIPVPATYNSLIDVKHAIQNRTLFFPIIVKPRWGMGSIGIYQADNEFELDVFYEKSKNDIASSYLNYESSNDINHAVLFQEKIIGSEYGIDVLNDFSGNLAAVVPKKKIAMRAGETDSAIILDDKKLIKLGTQLSSLLKHSGNLDIDCFKVGDRFYVLEMNCRLGGQYPFSHLAGADFPGAIVSWSMNEKPLKSCFQYKLGTVGVKDIVPKTLVYPSS